MDKWINNHTNYIHGRALKIVCQYHNSMLDVPLDKNVSLKIYNLNLKKLIEIFKVKTNLVPKIKNDVFDTAECQYRLRDELQGINLKQLLLLA